MVYAGISAKEAGPQPPCECHGVPMYWTRDTRSPAGGFQHCAVKDRTRKLVAHLSAERLEKGRARRRVENLSKEQRAAKNVRTLADYRSGKQAERYADQLERGERILHWAGHHVGMAVLKTRLGDPRPEGLTLSLVHFDGPDTYDGYIYDSKHQRCAYRLSTNPDDYVWESMGENNTRDAARRASEVATTS